MFGIGAFVKIFASAIDRAAVGLGLILGGRPTKLCPIPVRSEPRRQGR